jgi:opacity protein-like surface antigen
MNSILLALVLLTAAIAPAIAADTAATKAAPKPAASKVDPALEAAHTKEDVRRHRIIAAAHEAAAKCQESGKDEEICDAELQKACQGIAYGKYCGMKHPD